MANAASPKGPSYDEVVKSIEQVVSRLFEKAISIRTKFVPEGMEIPRNPRELADSQDSTLFRSLVELNLALQDLEIELESVIKVF